MKYDKEEAALLVDGTRSARRKWDPDPYDDRSANDDAWARTCGWNDALDDIAKPLADQLEAAMAEIERLEDRVQDYLLVLDGTAPFGEWPIGRSLATTLAEVKQLRTKAAQLEAERDAALASEQVERDRYQAERAANVALGEERDAMQAVVDVSEAYYVALRDPDNEAPNEHTAFMNALSFYRAGKP